MHIFAISEKAVKGKVCKREFLKKGVCIRERKESESVCLGEGRGENNKNIKERSEREKSEDGETNPQQYKQKSFASSQNGT